MSSRQALLSILLRGLKRVEAEVEEVAVAQ